MPSLSRPIALSRPEAVSTVRGVGLPALGRKVTVLGITPPSRSSAHEPGHLADVAERPRGHQDRVLQRQPSEPDPQIDHAPTLRRIPSPVPPGQRSSLGPSSSFRPGPSTGARRAGQGPGEPPARSVALASHHSPVQWCAAGIPAQPASWSPGDNALLASIFWVITMVKRIESGEEIVIRGLRCRLIPSQQ